MNIENILSQLEAERDRIQDAISALKSLTTKSTGKTSARQSGRVTRRRGMSAAGRKRISDMMKARWAAHRKKAKKGRLVAA